MKRFTSKVTLSTLLSVLLIVTFVIAPVQAPRYELTINIVGSGSVAKDPDKVKYPPGTVVTLTAIADPGWTFSYWSGDLSGSANPETITMDSAKTVTATFTEEVPVSVRIPAEWEPHAATWIQWPGKWEEANRANLADIIDVLQDYEPVNILVNSKQHKKSAQSFLQDRGVPPTNINWYIIPHDWCWMRDNGPVWVVDANGQFVQDWGFDGWGGWAETWRKDDKVPSAVAEAIDVRCVTYDLINERGTLEFNGNDTLITSWSVLGARNPDVTQAEMEQLFKDAFGVTKVVWLLHGPSDDPTGGHVDGIARFINENTVAVARFVDQSDPDAWVYEEAADIIAAAGINVVRIDIPGYVTYKNEDMYCDYVNWLVANGVVVMTGFNVTEWDNAAKQTVEGYFPGRDVIVVETLQLWKDGGGVHCVTNDQPDPSITL